MCVDKSPPAAKSPFLLVRFESTTSLDKAFHIHHHLRFTPDHVHLPALYRFSRTSTTLLLALSKLPRTSRPPPPPQLPLTPTLLLLLPLRFRLASSRSPGCKPLARAYRLRISVRLTTPESRPNMLEPGNEDELTDGLEESDARGGCCGVEEKR